MTERVVDESGTILWEEMYVFQRPCKPGERIVRGGLEYIVISSHLIDADLIETVVRLVQVPA